MHGIRFARNWPARANAKRSWTGAPFVDDNAAKPKRRRNAMNGHALLSANLLIAYSAYFVGTASPGPSNLAIMSIASNSGRRAAFAFAAGVMSGSFFWAMLAALGLSAALTAYSGFL